MASDFKLPDLGEGITEGQILRILCAVGDTIEEDQPILEVETDKAAVEIPSPFAGTVTSVAVKEGETVAVGQVLMSIDSGQASGGAAAAKGAKSTAAEAPVKQAAGNGKDRPPTPSSSSSTAVMDAPAAPSAPTMRKTRAAAAPAVRKYARERGVDIDQLAGSGPGGRVLRADVESAAGGRGPVAEAPSADLSLSPAPASLETGFESVDGIVGEDSWGTTKRQRLTQIRKTIAAQMMRSVSNIPHVTQTDEADITLLDAIRRDLRGEDGSGPRVTTMAFLLRTLAICLRKHPAFNATFDAENEEIVYREYINLGVAVDSPRGLVVPVIRNADRLGVLAIAQELRQIADKVRNVQFAIEDLRGGTFTVTNYGAIGGIWGTPIINYPEVAILGIGRTQNRLELADDEVESRSILPLSISFDHRAVDGAQAARFLNDVVAHLSSPGLLMIQ